MMGNNLEGMGMRLRREARNLLEMVTKQKLAADLDLGDRVNMGTFAMCNTLLMMGINIEGWASGYGGRPGACWGGQLAMFLI